MRLILLMAIDFAMLALVAWAYLIVLLFLRFS